MSAMKQNNDLISRSAVKNIAAKYGAAEDFDSLIDQIPAVDAVPKWISVKAGLPKAYQNVDIAFRGYTTIGYYASTSKRWYNGHSVPVDGVTYWKYRDKPPKEDEEKAHENYHKKEQ